MSHRVAIAESAVADVFESFFKVNGCNFCLIAESIIVDQAQGCRERKLGQDAAARRIIAAKCVFSDISKGISEFDGSNIFISASAHGKDKKTEERRTIGTPFS